MKFVFRYTTRFLKSCQGVFSETELLELEIYLALNPEAGSVIRGGNGLRKVRFAAKGQGKRSGARVIYLRIVDPATIVLADCYTKNEQSNLSHSELETLDREAHE